ncbi:hypothetical protein [Streptomyces ziwulingensis]
MTDTTSPRRAGTPHTPAAGTLAALTAVLTRDLTTGAWRPGPLERRLARHLLLASAGDGALTADRVRAALWEGDVALIHAGEGRLARLLAHLLAAAQAPAGPATEARDETARTLLERLAEEGTHDRART